MLYIPGKTIEEQLREVRHAWFNREFQVRKNFEKAQVRYEEDLYTIRRRAIADEHRLLIAYLESGT